MTEIQEVAEVVTQQLKNDKTRDDIMSMIDEAVDCEFEPSPEIQNLPYIKGRHYGMTDISDARNAGTRTFANLLPQINIDPMRDTDDEYERTERAEQALAWEFERMNRVGSGKQGIHDQIVQSAVTYHAVAFYPEYLPYKYKARKEPRIKALLSQRNFNWKVYHPATVHAMYSDEMLERVSKVSNYSAQELIEKFGMDNPGIVKLLAKHRNATKADLMKEYYTLVDYMDWENRVQFAVSSSEKTIQRTIGKSEFVFMNEEHNLPFIPWVVADYGNPLWEAVIKSGLWANLQHINLIRFAKMVEMSTRSNMLIQTPTGDLQNVWLDFSNPSNPIVTQLDGTVVRDLNPVPLDPGMETQFNEMKQSVSKSTVAQILQDPTPFLNSPFSTFNASITSALGQLAPAKKTAEGAEAEGFRRMFQWIDHSKMPMIAYRKQDTDKRGGYEPNRRGDPIGIFPGNAPKPEEIEKMEPEEIAGLSKRVYFDLSALYINVMLQSSNMNDEQSKMNTNILAVDKLNASKRWAWERMGWKNYDLVSGQRAAEDLEMAEVQKIAQLKMLEVQAAQMQMQMEQQQAMQQQQSQQNQTNDMNAGSQFESLQGQDMRGGGNPAAPTAPNENRVSIQGQDAGGNPVP